MLPLKKWIFKTLYSFDNQHQRQIADEGIVEQHYHCIENIVHEMFPNLYRNTTLCVLRHSQPTKIAKAHDEYDNCHNDNIVGQLMSSRLQY